MEEEKKKFKSPRFLRNQKKKKNQVLFHADLSVQFASVLSDGHTGEMVACRWERALLASCPNNGNFLDSLLQFLKVNGHMLTF